MITVRHWTLAALLAVSLGGFTAGCGGEAEDDEADVEQVDGGDQDNGEQQDSEVEDN